MGAAFSGGSLCRMVGGAEIVRNLIIYVFHVFDTSKVYESRSRFTWCMFFFNPVKSLELRVHCMHFNSSCIPSFSNLGIPLHFGLASRMSCIASNWTL